MSQVTITIDDSDYQFKIVSRFRNGLEGMAVAVIKKFTDFGEDRLRYNSPVKTGYMRSTVDSFTQGTHGEAFTNSGYGKFVDEDTRPHIIRGNPFLRIPLDGKIVFARFVMHPGTKGQKFKERTIMDVAERSTDLVIEAWNELIMQ